VSIPNQRPPGYWRTRSISSVASPAPAAISLPRRPRLKTALLRAAKSGLAARLRCLKGFTSTPPFGCTRSGGEDSRWRRPSPRPTCHLPSHCDLRVVRHREGGVFHTAARVVVPRGEVVVSSGCTRTSSRSIRRDRACSHRERRPRTPPGRPRPRRPARAWGFPCRFPRGARWVAGHRSCPRGRSWRRAGTRGVERSHSHHRLPESTVRPRRGGDDE
jgi:hypothetical protein